MPELPLAHDAIARAHEVRRAAPLRADLHHPLVLACRGQDGLTLGDVHADWLLQVQIGTRLHRLDRGQRVPVVRRRDEDEVEVPLREHRAVVAVGARRLLRRLPRGDLRGCVGQQLLVDIAERHDFDRRHLDQAEQVALAVPAGSDQPDPQRLGGPGIEVHRPRRAAEPHQWRHRSEEITTLHGPRCRPNDGSNARTVDR